MKIKNIGVIISREYLTRVKKKSFLLTTFLVPVLFAAMCILPSVIMFFAKDSQKQVAVVDQSGIVLSYLEDNDEADYVDYSAEHPDSVKAHFDDLALDVLVVISPLDSLSRSVSVIAYSPKPLGVGLKEAIKSRTDDAVEEYRVAQYDIADLKQIMADIKSDVDMSTYTLDESGEEKITSSEVYMIISMILSMIIYMFIAMFTGMVMQSVIEEKSSRVVEVLVSSVKATELMFGKIIGVACVALTQFFLWIMLTAVLVGGFSAFVGFDSLMGDPASAGQMMEMAGASIGGVDAAEMMEIADDDSELGAVLSTLRDIKWGQMILAFVIYFALGYLLYASLFAAIGSAVENEADTNQLQMPVTIPLLIAFFISLYAFNAPDSPIVFWGSMIPFTSPIVMLSRIPFGVPMWELVLSVALLAFTFVACAWVSAKIYKIGILMYGKKTTFKDLWKWLKQK
ncbi:MAG: ABC transporter permease [Bacteroidales bacterium]|nr:ABC transporter permease [Bacteroidales bacterium]MBQ6689915.1 ABC transporter permease [Bacteroidales bacterium]